MYIRSLFHCYNKRKSQERLMPSTWGHCIKMSLKCLHPRSTSYSCQCLVKLVSVKNLLARADEVVLEIHTWDMLTFKGTYKQVSLQTKCDFVAWLPGEHISEVLASEATHRSAMVCMILSPQGIVSKLEAKPCTLLSLRRTLTPRGLRCLF